MNAIKEVEPKQLNIVTNTLIWIFHTYIFTYYAMQKRS